MSQISIPYFGATGITGATGPTGTVNTNFNNLSTTPLFNSTTPYYSSASSNLVQISVGGQIGTITSGNLVVRYDTPCILKGGKVYFIQVQILITKSGATPSTEQLACSIFPLDTVSGCVLTTIADAGLGADGSVYDITLNGYISPTIDYNTLEVSVKAIPTISGSSSYFVALQRNTFIYINQIN